MKRYWGTALLMFIWLISPRIVEAMPSTQPVAEADQIPVRAVVSDFIRKLAARDAEGASKLTIEGRSGHPALSILMDEYASRQEFADAYKIATKTEFDSSINPEHFINKHIKICYVEIVGDAAYVWKGGFPLTRVDGTWKVDLKAMDEEHVYVSFEDLCRADAAVYRDAARKVRTINAQKNYRAAETILNDAQSALFNGHRVEYDRRFKAMEAYAIENVQGDWEITLYPSDDNSSRRFAQASGQLTIKGSTLTIEMDSEKLSGVYPLQFGGVGVETPGVQNGNKWSIRRHPGVGTFRGSAFLNDWRQSYVIVGERRVK